MAKQRSTAGVAKKDLDFLCRTSRRIRSMLSDAEEAEVREDSTKLWLRSLKDLVYDAEDILDLHAYELARAEVEGTARQPAPSLFSRPPRVQLDMADMVKRFWERFHAITNERYGSDGGRKEEDEVGDEDWLFEPVARLPSDSSGPPVKQVIFGRDDEMKTLIEMLLFGDVSTRDDVHAVAVVATGGVGKTSLVQHVYEDPVVVKHFDLKGWVTVSTDFDLVRLTREAVKSLGGESDGFVELNQYQHVLKKTVKGKRFLLVFDDVWNESGELWDKLTGVLKNDVSGSRILITTRDKSVANTSRARVLSLDYLPFEHCWSLFRLCAFGSLSETEKQGTFKVGVGREIVEKCKGVPLVVKAVGGFLRYEDDEERWNEVSRNELWKIEGGEEQILGPLQMSYIYMPTNLKPCFSYCSVFPKGHTINREELVRLWMVEGVIQDKQGRLMEDLGSEYVDDLLSRSFFQPEESFSFVCGGEKVLSVKMHDLIHDLAQYVSRGRIHIKSKDEDDLSKSSKEESSVGSRTILGVAQDAATASSSDTFSSVMAKLPQASGFRSMLLAGAKNHNPSSNVQQVDKYLECLHARALDLSKVRLRGLPESISNLKLLRYLTLSDTKISFLTASVCTLYNLQALNLRSTHLRSLPVLIGNLKQLRHLVLARTEIDKLPESVWTLHHLQLLDLSSTKITYLPDSVGNLRRLRHCVLSETMITTLPESIHMLQNLEILDLGGSRQLKDLPVSIGKMKRLRHIMLFGTRISRLPKAVFSLHNLQNLDLTYASNIQELPEAIGRLKNLRFLSLITAKIDKVPESICLLYNLQVLDLSHTQIRELPDSIGGLKSLHRLHLVKTNLKSLPESTCALRNLQILDITICSQLKEVPPCFWRLSNLVFLGGSELSHLPAGIGKLTKLETVKRFPVGVGSEQAGLAELKDLNFLDGDLPITGLRNVRSTEEGNAANMRNKIYLEGVTFDWNSHTDAPRAREVLTEEEAEQEEALLGVLQPHARLKKLHIFRYGGAQFPQWLGDPSFTKLAEVTLSGSSRCTSIPHFELLPSMRDIVIEQMPALKHVGAGISEVVQTYAYSLKGSLSIKDCPELRSVLAPAPSELDISGCENLESVGLCGNLMSTFKISDCPRVTSLQCLPTVTNNLEVRNCPLLGEWCRSRRHLELSNVAKVKADRLVIEKK